MSLFEFVSHESYPDDEYTKESVVLCIEKQHRVTFVRKKLQNGGMFWDVINASVKKNGEKKFLKSYSQDSNFLHEDIKIFLENRIWEKKQNIFAETAYIAPNAGGNVAQKNQTDDELPF